MIALLILVGQVTLWAVCDFSLDVPDLQNLLQFQHCFHLVQVLELHLWPPHLADDRHAPAAGHHLQSPVLWAPGVNGAGKTTTFKMLEWRHPSDLQTCRHQDTHGLYWVACDQTCLLRSLDHGKRTLRNLHSWSRTFLCGDAGPFAFRAVVHHNLKVIASPRGASQTPENHRLPGFRPSQRAALWTGRLSVRLTLRELGDGSRRPVRVSCQRGSRCCY
ncbi:uncharacterized protein LOC105088760 isoform X4 [Camelus dromedarius]|uniref:uncharacterized protein LOC105088760 isoform X4 n=1 Tax=Camelus dromedarius TaxID=9838 RepID=UPI00311A3343